jgi:type II secretory pathway pseudopilin PulG
MSPITIGVSIMVVMMITLSSVMLALQDFDAARAKATAKALQTVSDALSKYEINNSTALINGSTITAGSDNVANTKAPTAAELKAMGLLSADFASNLTFGGAYLTQITFPNTCKASSTICPFTELTYLQHQFLKNGKTDLQFLGDAVASSTSQNFGFSTLSAPTSHWHTGRLCGTRGMRMAVRAWSQCQTVTKQFNWHRTLGSISPSVGEFSCVELVKDGYSGFASAAGQRCAWRQPKRIMVTNLEKPRPTGPVQSSKNTKI